jgi:hypothetical protein
LRAFIGYINQNKKPINMNTDLMTAELKMQYEMQQENERQQREYYTTQYKQSCRREALQLVPKTKQAPQQAGIGNGLMSNTYTAINRSPEEIIKEAEIIYQWLIKTEA